MISHNRILSVLYPMSLEEHLSFLHALTPYAILRMETLQIVADTSSHAVRVSHLPCFFLC